MASPRVLVVGSGVIGLRTSLELLKRNIPVVLRSPVGPLDTTVCSQGAGGFWMPFHCDDPRTYRWSIETLDELHPLALAKSPLVETVPTVIFQRENSGPSTEDMIAENYNKGTGGKSKLPQWSTDARLEFQHLTVEMLWWQNYYYKLRIPTEETLLQNGYKHAWFFQAPIVDSPKMLQHMLEQVECDANAEVNVETGEYYESIHHVLEEARSLGCNRVLNATGLGAGPLCQDDQVVGARGILLHYDRKSCVRTKDIRETSHGEMVNDAVVIAEEDPWGSYELPSYIIPRGDILVVGGSYLEGDTEEKIRPEEKTRLLENARNLGIDTSQCQPISSWAGFRPYRRNARLEIDAKNSTDDLRLVHSYGYGGSGWTVFSGCARDATALLLE
jgi:D-amino-acid oxidase